MHIKGGAGKFARATGDFNNIGAADLGSAEIVVRAHHLSKPESKRVVHKALFAST